MRVKITFSTLSLNTISIIVGIILSILQGLGTIDIGWFWATFPFWIMFAVEAVLNLILVIICVFIFLGD